MLPKELEWFQEMNNKWQILCTLAHHNWIFPFQRDWGPIWTLG